MRTSNSGSAEPANSNRTGAATRSHVAGAVLALLLSGCDVVSPASVCASAATQSQVIQLIRREIDPTGVAPDAYISASTYQGIDRETGLIQCQGQLALAPSEQARPVRFARQRTADGGEYVYYVEKADLLPFHAEIRRRRLLNGEVLSFELVR